MAEPINVEKPPEKPVIGKKLNLRKKLGMVTLITPPSFFQNQNKSFALINLSKRDKDNFADQVNKYMPFLDVRTTILDPDEIQDGNPNLLKVQIKYLIKPLQIYDVVEILFEDTI